MGLICLEMSIYDKMHSNRSNSLSNSSRLGVKPIFRKKNIELITKDEQSFQYLAQFAAFFFLLQRAVKGQNKAYTLYVLGPTGVESSNENMNQKTNVPNSHV